MDQIVQNAKWVQQLHTRTWNCSSCGNTITGYKDNPQKFGMTYCPQCGAIMNAANTVSLHQHASWVRFYFSDLWECSLCRNRVIGYNKNPALCGYRFCPQCGAFMSSEAIQ